ncbi:MAG: hypothetical protein ACFFB2_03945 [Promethearchaeota archaeon]
MLDDIAANLIPITLLLITGLVALVMAVFLLLDFLKNRKVYHLAWAISFLVLFVSGVLIIINGFTILEEPLVPVVAAFIPACLAIGLFFVVWDDKPYGLLYTVYTVVMVAALAVVRLELLSGFDAFSTPVLMGLHIPSGLSIVGIPLYTAFTKKTEITSIFYSIGGFLISFGGVLLAFLKLDAPILTADQIFDVLPLLLVIVGVLFVLGILLPEKWRPENPLFK